MIRRLDLAGGAALPYRFPYILNIAELIVYEKISNLSGTALTNLFVLIDALLMQGTINAITCINSWPTIQKSE